MELFTPMVAMADLVVAAGVMQVLAAAVVIPAVAVAAGPCQDGAAAAVPIIMAQVQLTLAVPGRVMDWLQLLLLEALQLYLRMAKYLHLQPTWDQLL